MTYDEALRSLAENVMAIAVAIKGLSKRVGDLEQFLDLPPVAQIHIPADGEPSF